MTARCPDCKRTFEDCRCTGHNPTTCHLCGVLRHPAHSTLRPAIPQQRRAS